MNNVWRRKKILIPTAILMVALVGTVAASILLFTHNFPKVTVPGTTTLVVGLCTQPTLTASAPSSPQSGIVFSCGTSVTSPAFATTAASATFVTVAGAPVGGLPTGYNTLFAVPAATAVAGISCSAEQGAVPLLLSNGTPGSTLSITVATSIAGGMPASTNFVYCADFSNGLTTPVVLSAFTVSWSQ